MISGTTAKSAPVAASRGQSLANRRHRRLVQEPLRAERHDEQAVGGPGGGPGQPRAQCADVDRWRAVRVGAGAEGRGHQRVPVVVPAEIEPFAGVPRREDGPQRAHQFRHPGNGPVELRAEPLLDLRPHLRAKAERETPLRQQLQVIRLMCEMNRIAGKRDRNVGHQVEALDRGGQGQRREHVVRPLEGEDPAGARFAQDMCAFDCIRRSEQRCHYLHGVRA